MIVRHLSLGDFRNYTRADVALLPGATLFVGSNGQGKTNLVEALGFLSTLGSHRVSTDQALIRQGAESAVIRALLQHAGRELRVEVQINRSAANRAQVNSTPTKPRELPRYFSSVLFAPEDLALVRGDPSGRRRLLDQLLVLRTPRLAGVLSDYDRALKQRNTLLKSARARGMKADQLGTLDIWDERLVAIGSQIIAARGALVEALQPELARAYLAVAGSDHGPSARPELSILADDPGEDDIADETGARDGGRFTRSDDVVPVFTAAIARMRPRELERGLTLVGPHRDDVLFRLNGLPAKGYASHGESWSFALALKLASAELLRRDSQTGDPVLILDDVFAELDQARRGRLAEAVTGFEQVLITAAVFEDVPAHLAANAVHIRAGEIVDAPAPASEPDAEGGGAA
ncbi:DNA replication/repair protein RecF [Clavibacter michiganensis]|uniref:DNA replication and repair protein RecF n=1 Tax=Clavibacter michiganensis subsp. michiganensis (strain NCPPB 382) TaxID=443906 RepID=RECF_CLAM3|nr:DNA replication/repair protein RecF [Clavibacter michiganensis]A5CLT6.1 RecName: Full=DNA replication and repair protein RecF [Clavibacter michiganensis subsp. michiganensis NCPPB 382]MWJ35681.1 DNA replication/repair protein RecF [Clavibacter michiganensis subsp. michiganensis]MWJ78098.1 DNA replication/repair protein RecF [Clavibacter michiganensis subsp. michiganensis]CAN00009.1 DNA replication and repair protein RecF [Clavibacter michiganensis subsp. michiganensis NCPPB 382]